jgi:hypothetical protein
MTNVSEKISHYYFRLEAILKIEVEISSETFVSLYHKKQQRIPDDSNFRTKTYFLVLFLYFMQCNGLDQGLRPFSGASFTARTAYRPLSPAPSRN